MNDWSTEEKALLALNAALGGYDWGYTQWAVGHDKGEEANPRLGKHPSRARIDQGFGQVAALAAGGALALPKEWRKPALAVAALAQFANSQGALHGNDRMDQNPKARETGLKGAAAATALSGLLGHWMGKDGGPTLGVSGTMDDPYVALKFEGKF